MSHSLNINNNSVLFSIKTTSIVFIVISEQVESWRQSVLIIWALFHPLLTKF